LEAAGTKIVVIGCGDFRGLPNYIENTGFNKIFVDSDRKLFFALGMDIQTLATAPSGQAKPSYVTEGYFSNLWKSIKNGPFKDLSLIGKEGNHGQLGGDFVFGPGNRCTFAHRMQHTQDHIEVVDLMKHAGVILP